MLRKIVTIKEDLCDGCGECIVACAEGALEIIDGKAKLVKEDFCDGFGDCIGNCPTGALIVEEKESNPFDPDAVKVHLKKTQGQDAVKRFEEAHERHMGGGLVAHSDDNGKSAQPGGHGHGHSGGGGCPGSAMREMNRQAAAHQAEPGEMPVVNQPELNQWPIQIHLVQPGAPFFRDKEMVVMNTCGPIASADVHWRYMRGRSIVVGCPKLDYTDPYAEKLGAIMREATIPKVIIVRMEVPCCGGLTKIVMDALEISGRKDLAIQEDVIKINGTITSRVLAGAEASA